MTAAYERACDARIRALRSDIERRQTRRHDRQASAVIVLAYLGFLWLAVRG